MTTVAQFLIAQSAKVQEEIASDGERQVLVCLPPTTKS
jgi:hypothetical protein